MRSMTGYGQASWQRKGQSIRVEIRSVNQRFLDVRLNMPREYMPWEAELRALVQARVERGKVDVSVSRSGSAAVKASVQANVELARAYVAAWKRLQGALRMPGAIDLGILQARADFFRVVEERNDPRDEVAAIRTTVRRALVNFDRERRREGRVLQKDIAARVRRLGRIREQLARHAVRIAPEMIARVGARVRALLGGSPLNEERLLQEVALLAEKADVTEEVVRLQSHVRGLTRLVRGGSPAGKKIDFLLQEVHREVNTIASKSADLRMTNLCLEARAEVEKLREQAQNIE